MLTLFLVDKLKLISEPEFIFLKISYRIFAEVVVLPSVVIFTSSIMSARSDNNMPIIVTGDFNEPSHLDWILGAENPVSFSLNNNTQFIVNWPISDKMFNVDMVDVYRYLYPDPIQQNGYTWTPNISLGEVHDRIDFIYCDTNDLIDINNIHIVGPDPLSDISVDNYESDHRGVFAIFNINNSIL